MLTTLAPLDARVRREKNPLPKKLKEKKKGEEEKREEEGKKRERKDIRKERLG